MSGTSAQLQSNSFIAPVVPQPIDPGEIVGLNLQNPTADALSAQYISFGEVFKAGAVPAGSQLVAIVNGTDIPVQMDVKTTYPDGSAETATITMLQPAIAANATVGVMLALAPTGTTQAAPVDVGQEIAATGYDLGVTIAVQGGSTYTLNVANLYAQAVASGSATILKQGPDATEVQFQTDVTGSLRMVFNVTAYANGTFRTNVQFDNDLAMQASGGTLTYNASITQGGQTAYQVSNLTQYQYEDWNQVVYTGTSAPAVNVQHDMAYLEQTGAIANYDLTDGVPASYVASEASSVAQPGWNAPLSTDGIAQYMPMTGGRPDIGPTTQANSLWLMTQNASAAQYALGQADVGAGIPWNFYNPQAGAWLNTNQYPNIRTDGWDDSSTLPTQSASATNNGWTPDTAHQPDLFYDAYLLTGDQSYLDALNAQAAFGITSLWPGARDGALNSTGNDNVIFGNQVRGAAWTLREIDEAAYANPTGSAEKAYFTQVMNDNWRWLVSQIPTWTTLEGQAHGYIIDPFEYGYAFAPWQQDYFISTAVQAAEMGNQDAVTFLNWATNYIAGSVLNLGHDAINYVTAAFPNSVSWNGQIYWDSTTNAWAYAQPLQTWSAIEANTQIYGPSNGSGWSMSNGDYGADRLQALAGVISVTGSPEAMQAYAWLAGSGAPYTSAAAIQAQPQFDIVPRLPDGNLLTLGNLFTFDSTAPGIDQGAGTADQLIVEEGNANVTLQGGNGGLNILANFGTGNDVLAGGDQGNYIFAGPGNDTIIGGAGDNYLQAGTIVPASFYDGATPPASVPVATTFVLNTALAAQDTIAGFQPGTDVIDLVSGTGQALSNTQIAAIISTATIDSAGDTVLQISADHSVTLSGIAPSALSPSFFLEADLTASDTLAQPSVLTVGPGQEYATLAQAAAVVQSGDTIDIQAGTYTNDFATISGNVTIQGVGGTATFVATETPPNDKGILDLTGNITVDNLAFTGASVPASLGGNGAGIRYESGNLVLNNDAFYGNQDGLLANPDPTGSIIINDSYFSDNGSGTGYTHNLYVNEVGTLLINSSTFTDAQVGHEIKSRALNTIITNSTIADGPGGTASYAIDLPNGGNATIVGNLIEKGPNSENPTMISDGEEGGIYPNSTLTVSGNILLNDLASPSSLAVMNDTTNEAEIQGNAIYGLTSAQIASGPATIADNSVLASEPALPALSATVQSPSAVTAVGASGTETLTTSGNLITGGTAALTLLDQAGDNTILGGAGGLSVTGAAGDQIITAAGSANSVSLAGGGETLDSFGTDTISATTGSNVIFVAGAATITTGAGSSNMVTLAGAGANLDSLGADTIFAATGANTITAAGASLITTDAGTTNTITLSGNDVLNSNGSDVIQLGAGNDTINATGAVTVMGGAGNVTLTGGAGEITFIGGTGSASITGGAGALNVTGGSGNLTLTGGTGHETFVAGTGNAVLNPGNSTSTITLGSGETTANLGLGNTTFYLLSSHPGGTDILNNLQILGDVIEPEGYGNGLPIAKAWALPTPSGILQLNLLLTDNTHLALTNALVQHY